MLLRLGTHKYHFWIGILYWNIVDFGFKPWFTFVIGSKDFFIAFNKRTIIWLKGRNSIFNNKIIGRMSYD